MSECYCVKVAVVESTPVSRIKDEPRWLRRACSVSALLHVALAALMWWWIQGHVDDGASAAVDIELAPEAPVAQPLAEEKEAAPAAATTPEAGSDEPPPEAHEAGDVAIDAGVPDARVRPDARPRPDARVRVDAGAPDASDEEIAATGDGDGGVGDGGVVAVVEDAGIASPDDAAAVAEGSGSGSGSSDDVAAEDHADLVGARDNNVAPGTAANLLAYFPKGHVITLLVRFDRLRGTEWAQAGERLLAPMPDYQTIIGDRAVHIADVFDMLVISTPSPRDVGATTLVGRSAMPAADLRALVDHDGAPVSWSAAAGGALGRRRAGALVYPGDHRVFLTPFSGWVVLAQPGDLGALTRPGRGDLDAIVARDASLPEWLRRVKTIETESGTPTGPALVLTMSAVAQRYELPDIGVGVTSVPAPERITLALQVDEHGFVARGNLRFATEADAIEMAASLTSVHDQVMDSALLQAVMRRTSALNLVKGLSVVRTGRRVSYATSLSIADGRALMAAAAQMVADYYGGRRRP
jgi:hypothetical protein